MKIKIFVLGCLMVLVLSLLVFDKNDYKSEMITSIQKNKLISMNLEQTAGKKDYETVTLNDWQPVDINLILNYQDVKMVEH